MNDTNGTRERLLTHAYKLFASKGFDGTSVRDITSSADANLGAITYHFGSKEALYDAALARIFTSMAERLEQLAQSDLASLDRLPAIVHAVFGFFRDHPEAPPLVARELARPTPSPAFADLIRRNLDAVFGAVTAGQRAGVLRPGPPFLVAFTLMSQCVWFALVGPRLRPVVGNVGGPNLDAVVEHHIADVVVRAFAVEPTP